MAVTIQTAWPGMVTASGNTLAVSTTVAGMARMTVGRS